jgi:hypothetical protein
LQAIQPFIRRHNAGRWSLTCGCTQSIAQPGMPSVPSAAGTRCYGHITRYTYQHAPSCPAYLADCDCHQVGVFQAVVAGEIGAVALRVFSAALKHKHSSMEGGGGEACKQLNISQKVFCQICNWQDNMASQLRPYQSDTRLSHSVQTMEALLLATVCALNSHTTEAGTCVLPKSPDIPAYKLQCCCVVPHQRLQQHFLR